MATPNARASLDVNWKPTLLAVSNVDFKTPVALAADPTTGSLAVDVTVDATNVTVTGNIASGATDSGNPVKIGGVYNSTLPTLTTGQRGDLQLDSKAIAYMNMAYKLDATNDAIAAWLKDGSGTSVTVGQKTMANSIPVTIASDNTVTVTANAGTNLNTSALALETGGNLASIVANQTNSTQIAKIGDGTNTANVLKSDGTAAGQNAQLVAFSQALSVTLQTAAITASASGDNTLIAAQGVGKKIYVYAFELSFSGTVNAKFTDGAAGTNMGGLYYGISNAGAANSVTPPNYLWVGSANTALILNLSGATAIGGAVRYFVI